jgi:xanthine dehydrogenase YagR molybdenum-binding subunit
VRISERERLVVEPGELHQGILHPAYADVPPIEVEFLDMPDYEFNSIGVRGLGEIGITGTAAAVANAVFHATGVRVRDLPITVEKLL